MKVPARPPIHTTAFSFPQLSTWSQSKKLCLVGCQIFDKASHCPDRPWTRGQIPLLTKGDFITWTGFSVSVCVCVCVCVCELLRVRDRIKPRVDSHQHCSLISPCLPLLFKFSCCVLQTSSASKVRLQPASYYKLCSYYLKWFWLRYKEISSIQTFILSI